MSPQAGFRFKQFFIGHGKCAMKVGTDSIMLGCWASPGNTAKRILDIGTGSGLLAIMMAQKSQSCCQVEGVDINADAIEQARENADNCPWSEKLSFYKSDIQSFSSAGRFDLIISNPPYYIPKAGELAQSDPQFVERSRRQARHTLDLSFAELATNVSELIDDNGAFYCVLPVAEASQFIEHAKTAGLYCRRIMSVRPTQEKEVSRQLLEFRLADAPCDVEQLTIRTISGEYTADYKNLCKDFYLNF